VQEIVLLVEFVTPQSRFRPIRPRFWEREYGVEFLKSEFLLLEEFNREKRQRYPEISGTVVSDARLGNDRFLLTPASTLMQDYVTCICPPSIQFPPHMKEVTVLGKRIDYIDRYEIMVDEIRPAGFGMRIEPEMKFEDFQDLLLLKWSGIESPQKELLSFELISCPPISQQAGGLNLSLYDGTGEKLGKSLLSYLGRSLPSDIVKEKPGTIRIPWMKSEVSLPPFSWSVKVVDADRSLSQSISSFLLNRKGIRCSEISMTLGSERNSPKSLYDPPCALVDQPTVLPWNVEKRSIKVDPPPEITKHVIATHYISPTIGEKREEFARAIDEARQKLFNLAGKHHLPHLVARHGIFDPNFYGKPQSIVRLALASARAAEKRVIHSSDITKVFDNIFSKNVEFLLEEWPELFTSKGTEISSLPNIERQIIKFIDRNETKETGVSLEAIQDHFVNLNPLKLGDAIDNLKKRMIYEQYPNRFRIVPIE